jgi:short-chain fatty acids transporter
MNGPAVGIASRDRDHETVTGTELTEPQQNLMIYLSGRGNRMSTNGTGETVLERIGYRLSAWVERWMPSPFLFALVLSYVVFLAGIGLTGSGPVEMVGFWYDGFWAFLTFSMQMVLILMTGSVVAYHPRVNAGIRRLTDIPNTEKQAVVLVGLLTMLLGWVHWGLSGSAPLLLATEGNECIQQGVIDVVSASETIFHPY